MNKIFWKEHWDEILFVIAILGSLFFILRGTGWF